MKCYYNTHNANAKTKPVYKYTIYFNVGMALGVWRSAKIAIAIEWKRLFALMDTIWHRFIRIRIYCLMG